MPLSDQEKELIKERESYIRDVRKEIGTPERVVLNVWTKLLLALVAGTSAAIVAGIFQYVVEDRNLNSAYKIEDKKLAVAMERELQTVKVNLVDELALGCEFDMALFDRSQDVLQMLSEDSELTREEFLSETKDLFTLAATAEKSSFAAIGKAKVLFTSKTVVSKLDQLYGEMKLLEDAIGGNAEAYQNHKDKVRYLLRNEVIPRMVEELKERKGTALQGSMGER